MYECDGMWAWKSSRDTPHAGAFLRARAFRCHGALAGAPTPFDFGREWRAASLRSRSARNALALLSVRVSLMLSCRN